MSGTTSCWTERIKSLSLRQILPGYYNAIGSISALKEMRCLQSDRPIILLDWKVVVKGSRLVQQKTSIWLFFCGKFLHSHIRNARHVYLASACSRIAQASVNVNSLSAPPSCSWNRQVDETLRRASIHSFLTRLSVTPYFETQVDIAWDWFSALGVEICWIFSGSRLRQRWGP